MKKLILLEYFTSQSSILKNRDKEIFREALNLANSIIRNFIKSRDIDKIYVIRNKNLKTIESEKVKTYFTNPEISYTDILNRFKKKSEVIIIAPETNNLSSKIYSHVSQNHKVLGSNISSLNIFSSKTKMLMKLRRLNLPIVENYKLNLNYKGKIIFKPDTSAGSENTFVTNKNNYEKKKGYLVQKFYNGKKGSFLMLCKNGKSKVICCNEQLLNLKKEKIQQVGCIMGGLEKYRNEIKILANKISKNFKGLFGIVGVDIVMENKKWLIIEINPRFTSAYSGLNKSYSSLTIKDITDFYVHKKLNDTQPRFLKKYEYYF
ncbi:MAG: hypothetical protein CM15mP40_02880 [Alphaproteobacteria bacterium]|nr:MAG: hypothetical protein CM15mP40_02880 [Alphaproteobacteria bacterium]